MAAEFRQIVITRVKFIFQSVQINRLEILGSGLGVKAVRNGKSMKMPITYNSVQS